MSLSSERDGGRVQVWKVPCGCTACIQRGGGFWVALGATPPNLEFDLIRGEQKNRRMYSGFAKAWMLDFCGMVPALDENNGYAIVAQKIVNKDPLAWQRMLDQERQENIGRFWRSGEKHIANSVMMSLDTSIANKNPDELLISQEEDGASGRHILHADWMGQQCNECRKWTKDQLISLHSSLDEGTTSWEKYRFRVLENILEVLQDDGELKVFSEHCVDSACKEHPKPDFNGNGKPLQIIDGQHRTRGMNSWENFRMIFVEFSGKCTRGHISKTACEEVECDRWVEESEVLSEQVPVTISHFLKSDKDPEKKSAIFLEVNTKAEDLSPFHKLAMLAREMFPSTTIKNWPGSEDTFAPKDFDFSSNSKLDYLRYNFILILCSNADRYPFHDAIPMLKVLKTKENTTMVDIRDLWSYLEKWNNEGHVFSRSGSFNRVDQLDRTTRVFAEYFQAWAYHLSGPVNNTDDAHFWAPSHPEADDWGRGEGGWAWKRAHAVPTVQRGSKTGHVTTAQNNNAKLKEAGIWSLTGYMRFIFDLFEPICSTILRDQKNLDGMGDWTTADYNTQRGYNGVHDSLCLSNFKDKVSELLEAFPFGGAIFDAKDFGLKGWERLSTIHLVTKKLGWVVSPRKLER